MVQGPYRKSERPPSRPPERPNFIYEWRLARNITQKLLAELVGLTPATISQIENGGRDTTIRTLRSIAFALDVEPGWLLSRNPSDDIDAWSTVEELKKLPRGRQEWIIRTIRLMMEGPEGGETPQ